MSFLVSNLPFIIPLAIGIGAAIWISRQPW